MSHSQQEARTFKKSLGISREKVLLDRDPSPEELAGHWYMWYFIWFCFHYNTFSLWIFIHYSDGAETMKLSSSINCFAPYNTVDIMCEIFLGFPQGLNVLLNNGFANFLRTQINAVRVFVDWEPFRKKMFFPME